MDFHAGVESVLLAHLLLLVSAGVQRNGTVNFFVLTAFDMQMLVAANLLQLIGHDDEMTIVANRFIAIILNAYVLVAFGINEYLLFALLVFDAKLVEPATTLRTIGLKKHRLCLFVRQLVRRHFGSVVN